MVSTRRKGWGRSLVMGLISGCSAGSLLWPSLGQAQIVPDRTLGTQVNSTTTLPCTGFCQITSGSQRGSNLFHSFQQFSLPNGDTADFVVDPTIQNVIVRVTGTNASNINGLIATTDQAFTQVIPTNFFLLNPNGIIFGPNARIFVGGAFLASTAERMLFQDGTVFDTRDQTIAPLLTISVPIGLQIGKTPGAIQIQQDQLITGSAGNSQFSSFILVGGEISLDSSTIVVPGQRVELGALAGGTVELQQRGNTLQLGSLGNSTRANVSLTNQSLIGITATNDSSGSVSIYGQDITLSAASSLATSILSGIQSGDLTVDATGTVSLIDGSGIINGVLGVGNSGSISVTGQHVKLINASIIGSLSAGTGNAGKVTIKATDDITLAGRDALGRASGITTAVGSATAVGSLGKLSGDGNGGDILLQAPTIFLQDGAQIFSSNVVAHGNAGNVRVEAPVQLKLTDHSTIQATTFGLGNAGNIDLVVGNLNITGGSQVSTSTYAHGNAGIVQVNATAINLDGTTPNGQERSSISSEVAASNATGTGGDVILTTSSLSIINGAVVTASTNGNGNAGNVRVNAKIINLDGTTPNGQFSSGISSEVESTATGAGGNVTVTADILHITNGAVVDANTSGNGNAGNIEVNAKTIDLDGTTPNGQFGSGIGSEVESTATGVGGSITVTTDGLHIADGAQVNASTIGNGNAGNIQVNARIIDLDGTASNGQFSSGFFSFAAPKVLGAGGNLTVKTDSLSVINGAQVNASTFGNGNAGNVRINATGTVLFNGISNTGIPSGAGSEVAFGAEGKGGDVEIISRDLNVTNRAIISASSFGNGDAGNILTDTENSLILDNESQISALVGVNGRGKAGDIDIQARTLTATGGAQIASILGRTQGRLSGGQGQGGDIRVNVTDSVTLAGSGASGFSSGILTLSERGASGDAGNVAVNTDDLRITDGALIVASTFNNGNAGNIVVNANTVEAINGGQIVTDTRSSGRAGNITLNAKDSLLLAGSDPNSGDRLNRINQYLKLPGNTDQLTDVIANVGGTSGLFANTEANSSGSGGSISITSPRITIQDGAGTFVNSQGSGQGGNIQVQGGRVILDNKGTISAETASAQGGNITLDLRDILLLRHNSLISTTAGTAQAGGNGGNITIKAPFIIGILSENSDITANAFTGSGGNIDITTNGIYGLKFQPKLTPFSDITASSQFGLNGTVILNLLNVDPSRSLTQLPENLIDTNRILANSCLVRDKSSGGVFLVTGTGGLPEQPDNTLPMFPTGTVRALPDASPAPQTVKPTNDYITEAQGIYRLPDGQVILSWECNEK